mgnify:CR=1 FL=1
MDKDTNRSQDLQKLQSFIEDTREGKYSGDNVSFKEILQCTITREDVLYIEDEKVQNVGAVLYGIY